MASAAILRSVARSLRLWRPLDRQGCLLARRSVEDLSTTTRLLSSSVPTELDFKRTEILGFVGRVQTFSRALDMEGSAGRGGALLCFYSVSGFKL
ncbi:hypothetical protein PVAP13_8NG294700 [Panicum virgatum]|uniref:Uncharacterized protein n=1 Tax=Panicum virgatum TaxID=38727 RepID=A0A8T0PAS2_PANVG|nr:hypothetical protein PVAP13_8NG294700 [Panicum virgatum]